MLTLWEYGIGFNDARLLIDRYSHDLDYILEKIGTKFQRILARTQLQSAEVSAVTHSIGSEKGNSNYKKWVNDKRQNIIDLTREKTIFEKLKESKYREETVFQKLKRAK